MTEKYNGWYCPDDRVPGKRDADCWPVYGNSGSECHILSSRMQYIGAHMAEKAMYAGRSGIYRSSTMAGTVQTSEYLASRMQLASRCTGNPSRVTQSKTSDCLDILSSPLYSLQRLSAMLSRLSFTWQPTGLVLAWHAAHMYSRLRLSWIADQRHACWHQQEYQVDLSGCHE